MDSFGRQPHLKAKRKATVRDICPPLLLPLTKADIKPGSDNERVGVVRDSMLQNHLILKPELGRTRRIRSKLPGSAYVYGLTLRGTDGGVPEAIGHWQVMVSSITKQEKKPKDFIALNYKGIKSGLITAKELCRYHQAHDICIQEHDYKRFPKDPPRLPDAMTYGMPNRTPTPIVDVLQHKFKDLWVQEQKNARLAHEQTKKLQEKRLKKGYDTFAVMIRRHQIPVKLDPLWHLPRFGKTVAHLDTFPTRVDRVNAFKAQEEEVPVRRGKLARGIYTHL
ncbi:cilia- and flagella-associated protein 77-like [Heteronotia binoei]|uniref:cilia- and flagella-associated protein 77-like n=1 Tax=Heteronotia binoei TaxID=13085 RepID=UPI00292E7F4B|nr:cilia- and flagella-associated protein 77-like [Heteronotia binoei]